MSPILWPKNEAFDLNIKKPGDEAPRRGGCHGWRQARIEANKH